MDDYDAALNLHVNLLLTSYACNPEYYSKKVWMVRYIDKRGYEINMENINALFVIDYMIKRNLDKFLRFTLHQEYDEFYWLSVDEP